MPNKLLLSLIFTHIGLLPSAPAISQVLMSEGVYEVPMADPMLKPFASLRLEKASLTLLDAEKNNGVVTYVLPRELTGRRVTVELKGTKTPGSKIITFKGDQAESTCAGGWANLQCNIAFDTKKLAIDKRQVDSFLRAKFDIRPDFPSAFDPVNDLEIATGSHSKNELDYLSASEVAKQFSNEAIGFIKAIKTPGESRASALDLYQGDQLILDRSQNGERWIRIHGQGILNVIIEHQQGPIPMSLYGRFGRFLAEVESLSFNESKIEFLQETSFTIYLRIDDSLWGSGSYKISSK